VSGLGRVLIRFITTQHIRDTVDRTGESTRVCGGTLTIVIGAAARVTSRPVSMSWAGRGIDASQLNGLQ
jgi:hypothetical protein